MKPSRTFWGTLFVVFGLLMLVGRAYDFEFGFMHLWKFWPLAFVVVGLAFVFKSPIVKNSLAVIAALCLAFFFYGLFSFQWLPWHGKIDIDDAEAGVQVQEFSEPFAASMKKAVFSFDAAAGKFEIDTSSAQLFKATIESAFGRYDLNTSISQDEANLSLKPENDVHVRDWKFGNRANEGLIALNPNPVWDLDFDIGAAKVECDLSAIKVSSLTIDAGAASVRLKLGTPQVETQVRLDAGASSVRILVPEDAGVEIRLQDGLSSKRFEGFEKIRKGTYQTANFDRSEKKIFIDADTGVSSLHVNRY